MMSKVRSDLHIKDVTADIFNLVKTDMNESNQSFSSSQQSILNKTFPGGAQKIQQQRKRTLSMYHELPIDNDDTNDQTTILSKINSLSPSKKKFLLYLEQHKCLWDKNCSYSLGNKRRAKDLIKTKCGYGSGKKFFFLLNPFIS